MRFLLDTNIVIAATLGMSKALEKRLQASDEGDLVTSAIVLAEVMYRTMKGRPPALQALELFLEQVPAIPFDRAAADAYAAMPFKRGGFDRLIAAHALSRDLIVVTENVTDFVNAGLTVENWLT